MQQSELNRLVIMVQSTNLVALDRAISCLRRTKKGQHSFAVAASMMGGTAERICRAAHEVRLCLPPEQRPK